MSIMTIEKQQLIEEINRLVVVARKDYNLDVVTFDDPDFGYTLQVEVKTSIQKILKEVHKLFGSIIYDESRIGSLLKDDLSIYMSSAPGHVKIDVSNVRQGNYSIHISKSEDSEQVFLFYCLKEMGGVNTKVATEIVEGLFKFIAGNKT
jgi:hypothetical protein